MEADNMLVCTRCKRKLEEHAVVNSDGERIWPVPPDFNPPPPSLYEPNIDPDAFPQPFSVHLPRHLRKKLIG